MDAEVSAPLSVQEKLFVAGTAPVRRYGFPIERAGKVQPLIRGPAGGYRCRWSRSSGGEYRTRDETWSTLVMQNCVVLQTVAYGRFEDLADKLWHALGTVLEKTEHDRLGIVQRVGLWYIDVTQPRDGQDFRFYLAGWLPRSR